MRWDTRRIRKTGLAICYDCGAELIAPADGKPYWCTNCSHEAELRKQGEQE